MIKLKLRLISLIAISSSIGSTCFSSCATQKPLKRAQLQMRILKPNTQDHLSGDYDHRLWDLLISSHKSDLELTEGGKTRLTVNQQQQTIKVSFIKNKTTIDQFLISYKNYGSYLQLTKRSHIWGKPPFIWGSAPGNEVLALDKNNQLLFYDVETAQFWIGFVPISTQGTGRARGLIIKRL